MSGFVQRVAADRLAGSRPSPVRAIFTAAAVGALPDLGRAVDEPDPPVTHVEQVFGRHLAALEVVDRENRPVPPGQPGEKVLITNLYNTVQPFLRYELSDVVTMSPTPCPCGSPLPLVLKVEGRTDEMVWIRDGDRYRQVHPYIFVDFLDEHPALGWYQIVQEERNRFRLRASAAPGRQIGLEELRGVVRRGLQRYDLAELIQFDVEVSGRPKGS